MGGPGPVTPVERAVRAWLRRYDPGTRLVVAVSGGADSLALAWSVHRCIGPRAVAVTIDHRLQPGSDRQADRVVRHLRDLGLDHVESRTVEVGTAGGPEAAARRARLGALRAVATDLGTDVPILLGHTMDDQAETVLLGLARGSGPRSIAGMQQWRAPFGRPLLAVGRSDTEAACRAAGLEFWSDPQNVDARFTRVRLRHEVLPLVDEVLGGGVVPALARTADLLREDVEYLDERARELLGRPGDRTAPDSIPLELLDEHPALRRRMVRIWLQDNGIRELTADHLHRLDALRGSRPGAAVRLPGGVDVRVGDGRLHLER
ncbi:MAG: tRNA lysidine(34) synthetase TilS [Williamsia herbipolensis]|nr:tRNA lysidine(34) synthetase TilS [Williamsia herbipolensis]